MTVLPRRDFLKTAVAGMASVYGLTASSTPATSSSPESAAEISIAASVHTSVSTATATSTSTSEVSAWSFRLIHMLIRNIDFDIYITECFFR